MMSPDRMQLKNMHSSKAECFMRLKTRIAASGPNAKYCKVIVAKVFRAVRLSLAASPGFGWNFSLSWP